MLYNIIPGRPRMDSNLINFKDQSHNRNELDNIVLDVLVLIEGVYVFIGQNNQIIVIV